MNRAWYCFCYLIFRPLFFLIHPVFRTRGRERVPEGACLLCSNHSGMGDPFWLIFALHPNPMFRSMAKIELMKTPVLGAFLRSMGVFGVNRGHHDMAAVHQAAEVLKSGQKLLLNPEGTRVKKGQHVRAKTGAVRLAAQTGAPIVPIYISPRPHWFSPVKVIFGEPITVAGDPERTSEEYHNLSDQLLQTIYRLGEGEWA